MGVLGLGLKLKQGIKTIKIKPTVGPTGTSKIIKEYKKMVTKDKVSPEKKAEAVKHVYKFSRKHGLTKGDVDIGKALKKEKKK